MPKNMGSSDVSFQFIKNILSDLDKDEIYRKTFNTYSRTQVYNKTTK